MGRAGSRFCRLARVRHHSRWAAPTGRPAPYPARPTNPTPPTELTTEPRNRSHTNRIRRHRITSQGAGFTSSQIYTGNGTPPMVRIKGAKEPVAACRLLGMGQQHRVVGRAESTLVGRRSEMSAVEGLLERAIDGHGAVVGVVGLPGIGKSRLVREVAAMAAARDIEVFTAFCESHAFDIPFHVVARLP